jgi:TonB family protein
MLLHIKRLICGCALVAGVITAHMWTPQAGVAASAAQAFFREPQPLVTVDPVIAPTVYQGGTVVLRVSVSDTGAVTDIAVLNTTPALTDPVVNAVRQWRFSPARLEGTPVAARTTVVVYVALQRNVAPGPGQ